MTFGLNCVYSTYPGWFWMETGWLKVIEAKNKRLQEEGRKPIRRFHSKDLSNYKKDFEDWDGAERDEFTRDLLSHGINGNFIQSVGFTANLKELAEDWPRVEFEGVRRFGYHAILRLIMLKLEALIPTQIGAGARIMLVNERCEFDGVLFDAFNHYLRARPDAASLFKSITPMGWEDCTPLQVADFAAYEAMKESHRFRDGQKPRKRRKSLTAFLDLESVSGICEEIPRDQILVWKQKVEEKDRKRGMAHLNEKFDEE